MSSTTNNNNTNSDSTASNTNHAANFNKAKDLLNEGEKNRVLAVFLHTENGTTNWPTATTAFGAASVESMKVSVRNILRKLEKGGVVVGAEGTANSAVPAGKGRKRKAEVEVGEGERKVNGKKGGKGKAVKKEESEDEGGELALPVV